MDAVAQMQETDIMTILFPTIGAFVPLLEPKREEITKARKTFKYGATERHQLDVYYPANAHKKHPVLFYVYGGGFVSGERTLGAPADVAYGNVGLYFAARGFVTIIPDYRLVPHTTYPGPAEDLRDALSWVVAHADDLGPSADTTSAFFLGHSAGGVHTLTLLLEPSVLASTPELRAHIKGAVIASAPCHFDPAGHESKVGAETDMYYGSREATTLHAPLALLGALPEEGVTSLPPLALITCDRDPEWFKVVLKDFHGALNERGMEAPLIVAEGHNHISWSFALGTGQGEKWAEETVAWMQTKL
ncbi:alpha/beta hydrolase domain-containing protein [Mycena galopus ATCC 62051]|nr:alpha/beta hydrolase domain-containing protein [Mycena galopus ATCC 62051]